MNFNYTNNSKYIKYFRVLNYGYSYAFLLPSTVLLGGGIVILCGLVVYPADVGLDDPDSVSPEKSDDRQGLLENDEEVQGKRPNFTIFQLLSILQRKTLNLNYQFVQ